MNVAFRAARAAEISPEAKHDGWVVYDDKGERIGAIERCNRDSFNGYDNETRLAVMTFSRDRAAKRLVELQGGKA